jgi:hypothetical protein
MPEESVWLSWPLWRHCPSERWNMHHGHHGDSRTAIFILIKIPLFYAKAVEGEYCIRLASLVSLSNDPALAS